MQRRRLIGADTWETIFGVAYLIFGTNAMVALASLPLSVLLITTDPSTSWPALAIAAIASAPALTSAFAVFRAFSLARTTTVIRTFWAAWIRHLRRSLVLGALSVSVVTVLTVDVIYLTRLPLGAVLLPLLMVLVALALTTTLLAATASVERPEARLRDVLKAALFLGVRRWYLTAFSFVALGLLAAFFVESPGWALGLATAPLLYLAWANSRHTLGPVLPVGAVVRL